MARRAGGGSGPFALDFLNMRNLPGGALARGNPWQYFLKSMASRQSPNRPTREEAQQSFRDEAADAWRDYVTSGRHVTQDELDTWIDSLADFTR